MAEAFFLPQDPAIPLLSIYPKDEHSYHKDFCSTTLRAALFITARTWKQLRCPSIKEWIKRRMWYFYKMEYYSEVKNDTLKFADGSREKKKNQPE